MVLNPLPDVKTKQKKTRPFCSYECLSKATGNSDSQTTKNTSTLEIEVRK